MGLSGIRFIRFRERSEQELSFPSPYRLIAHRLSPVGAFGAVLLLHRIIRFDGFRLDDHGRVSPGEGLAFGGDGPGDIARSQSQCHGSGCSDSHCQVLDGLREALFLNIS